MKKAPAVTLPQVVMVLATVLPLREFDPLALDMLPYHNRETMRRIFTSQAPHRTSYPAGVKPRLAINRWVVPVRLNEGMILLREGER